MGELSSDCLRERVAAVSVLKSIRSLLLWCFAGVEVEAMFLGWWEFKAETFAQLETALEAIENRSEGLLPLEEKLNK
jgi:hypothetical protein